MANPTGSAYLTANTGYTWTDGDVYEIVQTDQQEGAALGASFAGLGVDNQPHQTLLNKIQYVHGKQIADESTIGTLQAFAFDFIGLMGANGYVKIPVFDVSRGLIQYIVQWGTFYPPGGVSGDVSYTVNWNIAFPNACYWALADMQYTASGKVNSRDLGVGLVSLGLASGVFFVNVFNVNGALDGFLWLAIGF